MLLREQGLDATTMSAVAEAADVATGTLYNYFPSKDALLVGLWTDATATVLDRADARVAKAGPTPQAQCTALLRLYCEVATVFPQALARKVLASTFAAPPEALVQYASLDARLMAYLGRLLAQWSADRIVSPNLDIQSATALLYGVAVTQMMSLMTVPGLTLGDAEAAIEAQVALVFSGLQSGPTKSTARRRKRS